MTNDIVTIFTDGACRGNPGPGGWGAVLRTKSHQKTLSGYEPHTTNNRMEMTAAIESLKALKKPCIVELHTDSQYLKQGITLWIKNWKLKSWKSQSGHPVKNQDLWLSLDLECQRHTIDWRWVKGHNGHEGNELADQLAREAIIAGEGRS